MHDTPSAYIVVEDLDAGLRLVVVRVAAVQLPPDKVATKLSVLLEVSV